MILSRKIFVAVVLVFIGSSCASKKEFTGFFYDPPNVTDTRSREIIPQLKTMFEFEQQQLFIDTDFSGARLHEAEVVNDELILLTVQPENLPINNSPWYAFRVHSLQPKWYDFEIRYKGAKHRYYPKLSKDGHFFGPISHEYIIESDSSITFRVYVGEEPLWISGQEIRSYETMHLWTDALESEKTVRKEVVGKSAQGRDLVMLRIGNSTNPKTRIVILGRQHPPEVSSDIFLEYFVRALADTSENGKKLVSDNEILVFPMVNPDGVELGHWRNNANGADLNRDWNNFNQPETQIIAYVLQSIQPEAPVSFAIDVHSTDENIVYPINEDLLKKTKQITRPWISAIETKVPDFDLQKESFDVSAPIFKNWMFRTFGCDAVTFEVHDDINRDFLRTLAQVSAEELSKLYDEF